MLERFVEEQEIRPHLGDGDGVAINQQSNLHLGGMAAISGHCWGIYKDYRIPSFTFVLKPASQSLVWFHPYPCFLIPASNVSCSKDTSWSRRFRR